MEIEEGDKKNRFTTWYNKHKGKFICVAVLLVMLLLGLIFFYWGFLDRFRDRTDRHFNDLEHRLASRGIGGEMLGTNGLYGMASIFTARKEYTLSLCHRALYRLATADKREILVKSDTMQRVKALVTKQTIQEKSHVVKTRLELHYNLELRDIAARLREWGNTMDLVKEWGLNGRERYLLLDYEVASNYAKFSTIKFVVSTEDIYRRVPRLKREVLLCSNRPGSTRRCSSRATVDGLLLINNTLVLPMEQHSPVPKNISSRTESETGTPGKEENAEEGINLHGTDKEALHTLENDIANLRLFHIIFYKESTGVGDSAEYEEYIALIVEPSTC